jgi:hypothetical protein
VILLTYSIFKALTLVNSSGTFIYMYNYNKKILVSTYYSKTDNKNPKFFIFERRKLVEKFNKNYIAPYFWHPFKIHPGPKGPIILTFEIFPN